MLGKKFYYMCLSAKIQMSTYTTSTLPRERASGTTRVMSSTAIWLQKRGKKLQVIILQAVWRKGSQPNSHWLDHVSNSVDVGFGPGSIQAKYRTLSCNLVGKTGLSA